MNLDEIRGKATISVPEAGQILGLGSHGAYDAARRGEIPTLRFGRTLRVPVHALLEMLDAHETAPGPAVSWDVEAVAEDFARAFLRVLAATLTEPRSLTIASAEAHPVPDVFGMPGHVSCV
jgi:hypothetical protein